MRNRPTRANPQFGNRFDLRLPLYGRDAPGMVQTPKLHARSSSVGFDETGLRDAHWFATRLRERAQERIVDSFRAHLEGGPEPADEDLAIFAKLAADEQRLSELRDSPSRATAQQASKACSWSKRARGWLDAARGRFAPPDVGTVIARALRARHLPAGAAVPATWRTVAWSAAAVCSLFAAFGLWYPLATSPGPIASASPPRAAPTPSMDIATTRTAVTPVVVQWQPAPLQPEASVPPEEPVYLKTSGARPPPAPVRTARSTLRQLPPEITAVRWRSVDPLAACRAMNFFSRAICMNNSCASRQNARHASCAPVVAQRRVDEARRNLTMMN